jgi:hypothetical protein
LNKGSPLIKYPFHSRGKVEERIVYLSPCTKKLLWVEKGAGSGKKPRGINSSDVTDIYIGRDTTPALRRHTIPKEYDDLVFSIVTD